VNVTVGAQALNAIQSPLVAVVAFSDASTPDAAGFGEAFAALDARLGGRLARLAIEEGFKGKSGQSFLVHDETVGRVLALGAGKLADLEAPGLRALAAQAVEEAERRRLPSLTFILPAERQEVSAWRFAAIGAHLGAYRYDAWRTVDVEPRAVTAVELAAPSPAPDGATAAVAAAAWEAAAVAYARDLINGPPATIHPGTLADSARTLAAESGLEVEVLDASTLRARGMNLLLAVGAASAEPPCLIRLTWRPPGATDKTPAIALVGKGITFDAGGYNIKPTGSMEDMKVDMSGGAAVLAAMKTVSHIRPGCVVHGLVPAAENLISGAAYKPGDVIRSYAGKTVEIMNTDAEGRLILADALAWAVELGASRIIDLATLTGACVVALGPHTAGLFANDDAFRDRIAAAAKAVGEDMWPMPLNAKLRGMLKSPIADMKNIGERWGGAITAALFLKEFVGEATWAHLDIAGPASTEKPEPGKTHGGTGFGVLTLIELLRSEV
jgi:leucyl aminopeptidase